jgi:hypothetical protein
LYGGRIGGKKETTLSQKALKCLGEDKTKSGQDYVGREDRGKRREHCQHLSTRQSGLRTGETKPLTAMAPKPNKEGNRETHWKRRTTYSPTSSSAGLENSGLGSGRDLPKGRDQLLIGGRGTCLPPLTYDLTHSSPLFSVPQLMSWLSVKQEI